MNKLLENLKEAINLYEKCEDVCAAEHIMAESIMTLGRCCREVNTECQNMLNSMFDNE